MAKTISDLAFYYQITGEWTNEMQAAEDEYVASNLEVINESPSR